MSDLAIIDPAAALERANDPGEFVVMALERGKSWLAEALEHGDLEALVNAKGYAATLRVAVMQKQLGHDAELSATELVRRAERCIAVGIRRGQDNGEIAQQGTAVHPANQYGSGGDPGLTDISTFVSEHEWRGSRGSGVRDLADNVTDEQFEEALTEAKIEKNLSRANVVRKVKGEKAVDKIKLATDLAASGHTTSQIAQRLGYSRGGMFEFLKRHGVEVPADAVVGRQRNFDSTRIVSATVDAVNGIGMLFGHIDYSALDAEDVDGWLPILNDSIKSLTTLRNRLKEVTSRG